MIRVQTIDAISNTNIVFLRAFEPILSFDSQIFNKTYLDQVKYFDMITKILQDSKKGSYDPELLEFAKHAAVNCIFSSESFSAE